MRTRDDLIKNCDFGACECPTDLHRSHILLTAPAWCCGHCQEAVFLRPQDLVNYEFTCERGVERWHHRGLGVDVHRCGTDAIAETVETMLDLTVPASA